jgi:hypothetical protein
MRTTMTDINPRSTRWRRYLIPAALLSLFSFLLRHAGSADPLAPVDPKTDYATVVHPLLKKYCLGCHSTELKKGSLDLERFTSVDHVRKDLKPWQAVIEMLETSEMPPKSKPQPTAEERRRLIAWTRGFLDAEARARAGDPGHVPMRRLSNAEYNCTIRDLTGVDLQPAREFPADGAAGEGFTNAAEALADVSPTLLNKYLNAAKDIADHAVLLPDGFRFSRAKTRRDWTDECLAGLRKFYVDYSTDGRLNFQPYLLATVRYRDELTVGKITLEAVAAKEKLHPKYLRILWQTLTDKTPSYPLDRIRSRWRTATTQDVPALTAEVAAWQAALWKFVKIGSYVDGNTVRQVANDPAAVPSQTLKPGLKPPPGQSEVVLYLTARDFTGAGKGGNVVWQRPRFEGVNRPTLLLRDYAEFGPQYEVDYAALFGETAKYLDAVVEAGDRKQTADELAKKHRLDAELLRRWMSVAAINPRGPEAEDPQKTGKAVPAVALDMLDEKNPKNEQKPAIHGWRRKGAELPILLSNASDKTEHIPGRASPHRVVVHPTPTQFVAAVWKSPVAGSVFVTAKIAHAHPACGNGIAWWIEHRRGDKAAALAEGVLNVGAETQVPARHIKVAAGDLLLLAVDARDGNHSCDLTEIAFNITEADKPNRVWDLAADVADNILDGNPHADKFGNKDVWRFVAGPARPPGSIAATSPSIPAGSLLAQWRDAASDPARRADAAKLAERVQALLSGARPAQEKQPDRILYDSLVSSDSPLLRGIDLTRLKKTRPTTTKYGLPKDRFGKHPQGKPADESSLVVAANEVIELRLPAALFRDREFVVEGKLDADGTDRVVQFSVLTAPLASGHPLPPEGEGRVRGDARWDGKGQVVASADSAAYKQMVQGFAEFRRVFPQFICFPQIVPTDEVVCLKLYHREDEPLIRLFLDDEQTRRLDRLWAEHRFITQWPVTEHKNLPLFIGFVTQDQPKALVQYFEGLREPFRKRAEEFEKDVASAGPAQVDALLDFAGRAYRRPLTDVEKSDLRRLYDTLRKKEIPHDEAFRTILARILVSPSFLFRIEQAPPGKTAGPVNDWELATRLSYFLWSTLPDDELRRTAAAGRLRDPKVLAEQTRRMLKDDRTRALAIEFGTQWLHVRGFDELKEKNETLFPTFDDKLRRAIYEESILFFQDQFQSDRPVTSLLDADYTFLNDTLAKHYGIPMPRAPLPPGERGWGEGWRRVDGVRKYGRGGILGLASVQAKESGASRTSPVLRGNWVVETLLGEKLPRPPANVPRLPEEERGNDGLTMRQLVEKHARQPECAVCHQRIDPFGFALERYDPIGRLRDKDLGGLPLDSRARLKDGTEFDGIDGLRTYLLTKKKDVIVRLYCRKLLGYALGRSVTLSDQPLIDEMVAELNRNDGHVSAAVLTIVHSPQFRMVRGSEVE